MADPDIDLSDGLVPKEQSDIDLSDGLVPKDPTASAATATDIPPPEGGIRDQIEAAINSPSNVPDTGWRGQIEKFGQGAAQGLTQPFLHPLKTLGSMVEATPAGAMYDLATGQPNASQQQGQAVAEGLRDTPAATMGQLAGNVAAGGVVGAAAEGAGNLADTARNFRPTPASNIVSPAEVAARKLTNAINPDPSRAPSYIKAAQQEVPNVIDYANRTSNPLRTQIEFSKAAEGYANEVRDHYVNNILGPNKDVRVPVSDGYAGKSYTPSGENPQTTATLGDIDQRIVDIGKELNKPRLNATDARSALASDADLMAEKNDLTTLLHKTLSDRTGISPQDIANVRQRVGRSYELANDTNAVVTKRGLQEGKPTESVHGLGMGNLAMKGLDVARGGPTAITDRAFQDAIKNFPGQAQPLPQVTGPKAAPAVAEKPRPVMPGTPADAVRYRNGRAYIPDQKSGWWIPKE